jgi:aspartyl-tRNA(Asn)/glutamyl-tRNA(Gln) amidotransferase subunit C
VSAAGLTAEDVRRVAALARLELDEGQVERYRGQLSAVLGYVECLRRVDLSGVEPLATPLDMSARLGEDEPGPTLPTETLMGMAPEPVPPFVGVPRVLGGGGGAT